MKKYVFRLYDPNFPKLFEVEKNRIRKVLGKNDLIEHIGSTSVPGLGGKGIIDICIATGKKNLKILSRKLQSLGYKFGPKGGSGERLFHQIAIKQFGKIRTHHVHVTFPESKEWVDVIKFRDYLRAYSDEALRYAKIKKIAGKKAKGEDGDRYKEIKKPYIEEVIKKA